MQICFLFLAIIVSIQFQVFADGVSGIFSLSQEYFPNNGPGDKQKTHYTSLGLNPRYGLSDLPSNGTFQFSGYFSMNLQQAKVRNGDIKELSYTTYQKNYELKFGISEVFWGKADSFNTIDIVNQRDISEDVTFKKKLGQPLVRFGINNNLGLVEFYWLPYFRTRKFPDRLYRLHTPYSVNWNNAEYESEYKKDWHNIAFRWIHYFSNGDIAFHAFSGTFREPEFRLKENTNSEFSPVYYDMKQVGFEGEYIVDGLRLKTEFAYRDLSIDDYFTSIFGLEYSIYNIQGSKSSITLLAEYLNDGRQTPTLFQNDVFLGIRYLVNDIADSQLLLGIFYDLEEYEYIISLTGSRKLYSNIVLSTEFNIYKSKQQQTPLSNLDSEDYIKIELNYYY